MMLEQPPTSTAVPRQRLSAQLEAALVQFVVWVVSVALWVGWVFWFAAAKAREEGEAYLLDELAQIVRLAETLWPARRDLLRQELQRHLAHDGDRAAAILDGAGTILVAHDPRWAGHPLTQAHPPLAPLWERFRTQRSPHWITRSGADNLIAFARWAQPPTTEQAAGEGTVVLIYDLTPRMVAARNTALAEGMPLLFAFLLLFAATGVWAQRRILHPLKQLTHALAETDPSAPQAHERFAQIAALPQPREFSELAVHIARAYAQIAAQHSELRLLARALETSPAAIVITDAQANLLWCNPAFTHTTGYSLDEVRGKNVRFLKSGRTADGVFRSLWETLARGETWQGELINRRKNGETYIAAAVITPVRDDTGTTTHYIAIEFDATREKALAERIAFAESHDLLTELLNRSAFTESVAHQLKRCHQSPEREAGLLVAIDLKGFRRFNDRYGSAAGDALLKAAARALTRCTHQLFDQESVVARLGADEFALLVPLMRPRATAPTSDWAETAATARLAQLRACLPNELVLPEPRAPNWPNQTPVVWRLGAVCLTAAFTSASDAIAAASLALARAKLDDLPFAWYDAQDAQQFMRQMAILEALQRALTTPDAPGLALVWQPQLKNGVTLAGAEALVRFHHPELGPISPAEFIPLAEQSDLIVTLGNWVLREATRQAAAWQRERGFTGTISVNLSPRQLVSGDFPPQLAAALAESGWPGSRLTLEITENILISAPEQAIAQMRTLTREYAVQWAIDDFGTGYSSLAYLNDLPVHELKIDQRFIRRLGEHPEGLRLVRAIVSIAETFELRVVAEGVEDDACAAALAPFPSLLHQGWRYGRPAPAAEFATTWLAGRDATNR